MIPWARSRSLCSSMQSALIRISSGSISLIPRSKRVLADRTDGFFRSKRCFAASVPSESFKEQKRPQRISKQARRQMIEAFVDSYRASNAGRFPTISHARKQLGGSYYVLRAIIQELEYNHKMSPQRAGKPAELAKNVGIAKTGESQFMKDTVAVEPSAVEGPHISRDFEKVFVEESASHSTIEIIHSRERTAECIENSVLSRPISPHEHPDKKVPDTDFPSMLVNVGGEDDVSDPIESPAFDVEGHEKDSPFAEENGKDDLHGNNKLQADASVTLNLDSEVDNLSTPVHDARGTTENQSSIVCAEEEVEQRINEKVSPIHDRQETIEEKSSCAEEEAEQRKNEKGSPVHNIQETIEERSSTVWAEEELEQRNSEHASQVHDIRGTIEAESSTIYAEDEHRSNKELSKSENLTSDKPITVVEEASSLKVSGIWGNLRSLADGIFNFWRKK